MVITETVADTLGNLDFIIETFKFTGGNRIDGMSNQAVYPFLFKFSEVHQSRDTGSFSGIKPPMPTGCSLISITNPEKLNKFFLHGIADRQG